MPDISQVLKAEVGRITRKTIKSELGPLRKALTAQRGALAKLKREIQAVERQLARTSRSSPTTAPAAEGAGNDAEAKQMRFSASGLAKQRKRLGLSAAAVGQLMGVSALSVYKWESGKVRPREKQLAAIAGLRKLGKRDAAALLDQLSQAS